MQQGSQSEPSKRSTFSVDNLARYSFLLLVFSLGFTQPYFFVFNRYVVPYSDLIFLATGLLWFAALLLRKTRLRWHQFYWLLGIYLASMVVSTVFSTNPGTSLLKLPGEIYLLGLTVLTFNIVRTEKDVKHVIYAWLAATTVCVLVGLWSLFLFYFDPQNRLLPYTRYTFGTLPPGNYLRLQATFVNGNVLCNYLSVSLILVLAAFKLGWINKKFLVFLIFGIVICSLLTISPGLGGLALSLGIWLWLHPPKKKRSLALAALFLGMAAAVAFLFATAISPNAQPDPPFYVDVPFVEKRIEPSARGLVWIDSAKTLMQYPFTGRGLGQDACDVHYHAISGEIHSLRDAHNMFLNVAAQQGFFGLAAIILIAFFIVRRSLPLKPSGTNRGILLAGLGIAFVGAFVYQGLGGSFEDTRYLWVLIGLILSTIQMPDSGSGI